MRESGFYWVKWGEEWVIALWDLNIESWRLYGSEYFYDDEELAKINETKLIPPTE